jgi:hypothetical protein
MINFDKKFSRITVMDALGVCARDAIFKNWRFSPFSTFEVVELSNAEPSVPPGQALIFTTGSGKSGIQST